MFKHAHAKELSSQTALITTLENSLNKVTRDKNTFFDELQLRQAEVESAQSHLESLQSQNTELQYQLRETSDRYTLLREEMAEVRREHESQSREPLTSAGEVARLLSATEAKYESKISDLKRSLRALEKERSEGEAEWSRKLRDKVREVDQLKKEVGSAASSREHEEEAVAGLKAEIERLKDESRLLHDQLSQLRLSDSQIRDIEVRIFILNPRHWRSDIAYVEIRQSPRVGAEWKNLSIGTGS
jgi:chromosome segregation ATPase